MTINPALVAAKVSSFGINPPDVIVELCPSTNSLAREKSVAIDTIFMSPSQSAGRGRNGRSFLSNEGGLYMTIALLRSDSYINATRYPLLCGLAVRNALLEYGLKSDLKWPNDVKVNGKKLCGILCENDKEHGTFLLGVGLNISNDLGEFSDIATSLSILNVQASLEDIAGEIYAELMRLEKEKFSDVLSAYRTACITIGSFVPGYGKAVGIDENGFLKVLDGAGNLVTVYNPVE